MPGIGQSIKKAAEQPPLSPFRRPTGKERYPHRISLDLDDEQYEWLRQATWQAGPGSSLTSFLRAAIALVADDRRLLEKVHAKMASGG